MELFGMNIGFGLNRREVATGPIEKVPGKAAEVTEGKDTGGDKSNVSGASFQAEPVRIYGERDALNVSPWYRAVSILADAVGQSRMEFQRMIPGCHIPTYETYNYGFARKLNYLLSEQPNEMMTAMDFWKRMAINRFNHGNGVAYIERDGFEPVNIWICQTAAYFYSRNEYAITYYRPGVGPVSLVVSPQNIIHWRNTFSFDGGITGVGTLRFAINALTTAATNEKQAQDMAAKGGKFKILLSEDQNNTDSFLNILSPDQRDDARKQLQEQISGDYDVLAVNGLIKAQVISQSATELNLLQSRIHDSTIVAQFSGVPLPMLMINSNNTYKAPEQLRQQFYSDTVAPMLKSAEQAADKALVLPSQYPTFRCHFNTSALMRLDPKLQMETIKEKLETGIYCVNEARAELGLPPLAEDKGGEQHLVSTNLQKLDDIKLGKNQEQAEPADN